MAWLTKDTLSIYFDKRLIAQLSSDADAPADPVDQVDATVTEHLSAAQQTIENACRVGKRYTPPFDDDEVTDFLRSIQARLAHFTLSLRRGTSLSDEAKASVEQAYSFIEQIQSGKTIPGLLDETENNQALQVKLKNPSSTQRIDRGLISDRVSPGFFPARTGVQT